MSKILETYIRSVLNEESLGTPTIDDIGIVIDGNFYGRVVLAFIDTRHPEKYTSIYNSNFIIGSIAIDLNDRKCHNGYEVKSSYSNIKGLGKYLYRMAGQYAHSEGSLLFADRESVSADAAGVWSYIYKNTDKEDRKPFDDEKNPKTPPKEDDCEINRQGRNTLNYAYDVNFPGDKELYEKMLAKGGRWAKNADYQNIDNRIVRMAQDDFGDVYHSIDTKISKKYKQS